MNLSLTTIAFRHLYSSRARLLQEISRNRIFVHRACSGLTHITQNLSANSPLYTKMASSGGHSKKTDSDPGREGETKGGTDSDREIEVIPENPLGTESRGLEDGQDKNDKTGNLEAGKSEQNQEGVKPAGGRKSDQNQEDVKSAGGGSNSNKQDSPGLVQPKEKKKKPFSFSIDKGKHSSERKDSISTGKTTFQESLKKAGTNKIKRLDEAQEGKNMKAGTSAKSVTEENEMKNNTPQKRKRETYEKGEDEKDSGTKKQRKDQLETSTSKKHESPKKSSPDKADLSTKRKREAKEEEEKDSDIKRQRKDQSETSTSNRQSPKKSSPDKAEKSGDWKRESKRESRWDNNSKSSGDDMSSKKDKHKSDRESQRNTGRTQSKPKQSTLDNFRRAQDGYNKSLRSQPGPSTSGYYQRGSGQSYQNRQMSTDAGRPIDPGPQQRKSHKNIKETPQQLLAKYGHFLQEVQKEQDYVAIKNQNYNMDTADDFEFFFGSNGPFSQHYKLDGLFKENGFVSCCAEQYMMYHKAVLFEDKYHADLILRSSDPREMKKLGRKVQWFDARKWGVHSEDIVMQGNRLKFTQNKGLMAVLFSTYPRILVEASPRDKLWGIGLGRDRPNAHCRRTWQGQNKLGYILTNLRNRLMKEHGLLQ